MMMIVTALCLMFATAASVYYLGLTSVGWISRHKVGPQTPRTRFGVLIPAHNEEALIEQAIQSVNSADYPASHKHVVVIADNCTDTTASVARRQGAEVIERYDKTLRGKGYALAQGIPAILAHAVDGVVILDADCELDSQALRILDREFQAGATVIQTTYRLVRPNDGPVEFVAAVGAEIENGLQAGLTRLGCQTWLRGTGMAFHRNVLEQHPWQAYGVVEDAEYTRHLLNHHVTVRFQSDAVIRSRPPRGTKALSLQRQRWRAAMFATGKSWWHQVFASKPLLLCQLCLTTILVVCQGQRAMMVWLGLIWLATGIVYVRAGRRVGAKISSGWWRIPGILMQLVTVTLGGLVQRTSSWQRTPRTIVS